MTQEEGDLSLRDFFSILRRRRRALLSCWAGIFIAISTYTELTTPLFRAQVLFRVQVSEDTNRVDLGALSVLAGPAQTFNLEQLLSPQILEDSILRIRNVDHLPEHEMAIAVQQLQKRVAVQFSEKDRNLVQLTVTSPSGREAAIQANELAQVMVAQITQDSTERAQKTRKFITDQLDEVQTRLHDSENKLSLMQEKTGAQSVGQILVTRLLDLKNKQAILGRKFTSDYPELKELNAQIRNTEKQLQVVPGQEVDVTRMARQVRLNEELFTMLNQRLEEARIVESAKLAPMMILEPAIEPVKPDYPNKRFNFTAGFVLGLVMGLVLVLAREHLDTSMVTTEEIEAYLGLPVLATIPHIERRAGSDRESGILRRRDRMGEARSRLIFHFPPQSPFTEVYHILRNNLMKGSTTKESHVYLFTSAVVAEGKSITAANFAIAAAEAGIPTLLVEADLRKPMVDKLFDLKQESGLTDFFYLSPRWESYLADTEHIRKGTASGGEILNPTGLANLRILPSGKLPPNPLPLLSSERCTQLIQSMRRRFPLVVLDGAPAMLFADSAVLGRHVDGVVLVYRFGRTAREVLSRAYNQLAASNAKILGVVVNDIVQGNSKPEYGYYSMYGYYGYEEHPPKAKAS